MSGVVMEVEWAATDEVADRIRDEWSHQGDLVFYLNEHPQAHAWFKELLQRFKLDELDAMALAVMAHIGDTPTMRSKRDALLGMCAQDYRGYHDKKGIQVTYETTLYYYGKYPLPEIVVGVYHGHIWTTVKTLGRTYRVHAPRPWTKEVHDDLKRRCLVDEQRPTYVWKREVRNPRDVYGPIPKPSTRRALKVRRMSKYSVAMLSATLVALNWAEPNENFDENTLAIDMGWVHPDVEKIERQEEQNIKVGVQIVGDWFDYEEKDKYWEWGDPSLVGEEEEFSEYLLTDHPGVPKPRGKEKNAELFPEFRPGMNFIDVVRLLPRGDNNRTLHRVDVLEMGWLRRKNSESGKIEFNEELLAKIPGAYKDIRAAITAAASHGCPVHLYHRLDDKGRESKQRFDRDGNVTIQKVFRKTSSGKHQYLMTKKRVPGTFIKQKCWKKECPSKGQDTLHRLDYSRDVCLACSKEAGVPKGEDRVICELFVPMNWLSHLFDKDPGSDMYLRVRIYGDYVEHLMKHGYTLVRRPSHTTVNWIKGVPHKGEDVYTLVARYQCPSTFRRKLNYDGSTPLMVPQPWNEDFLSTQLESGKRLMDAEVYLKDGHIHINTFYGEWIHTHYFERERVRSEPYYMLDYEPAGASDGGAGEFGPSPDYVPGRLLRHEKPSGAFYDYEEKYSRKAEYFVSRIRTALRTQELTLNMVEKSTHWVRMTKAPVPTTSWTQRCPWGE